MSCGNCSTKDGKPGGCQSHGSCGTGSCNKMNTHDWLMNMPIAGIDTRYPIVEVSFKNDSLFGEMNATESFLCSATAIT